MSKKSYQHVVLQIRERLAERNRDALAFYLWLKQVEDADQWREDSPDSTFVLFLQKEFPHAINVDEYSKVLQLIEHYGEAFVTKIGPWESNRRILLKPAILKDVAAKNRLILEIEKDMEKHKAPPSPDRIRALAEKVNPELFAKRAGSGIESALQRVEKERDVAIERAQRAEQELAAALARIEQLQLENKRMSAELKRLQRSRPSAMVRGA